jgi:hypothetical protein
LQINSCEIGFPLLHRYFTVVDAEAGETGLPGVFTLRIIS